MQGRINTAFESDQVRDLPVSIIVYYVMNNPSSIPIPIVRLDFEENWNQNKFIKGISR